MKKVFFERGFTLTELIIVIGIIVLLGTVTTVSYRKSQYKNDLKNSAEKLASNMRSAQGLALNGAVQNPGDSADMRYGIAFVGQSEYVIYRDSNGNEYYDDGDLVLRTENLAQKVTFLFGGSQVYSVAFPYASENSEVHYFENVNMLPQHEFSVNVYSERTLETVLVIILKTGVIDVYN